MCEDAVAIAPSSCNILVFNMLVFIFLSETPITHERNTVLTLAFEKEVRDLQISGADAAHTTFAHSIQLDRPPHRGEESDPGWGSC